MSSRRFALLFSFALASLCFGAQAQAPLAPNAQTGMLPLPNTPPSAPVINLEARQTTGQLTVPVDKSQLLHVDQAFGEISVGNRDIADVVPLTRNLIYVLGKKRGSTNLTISDQGGNVIAVVDVVVAYDIDAMRRGLADIAPEERVVIRPAGDALILSGQVTSSDRLRQILAVAERYAPGGVTNLLSLGSSQQVLLHVRFAEVRRTALKELGANVTVTSKGNDNFSAKTGLIPNGGVTGTFGNIAGSFVGGDIEASVDALEKKGLLRTLAEPNLVALSGDTASFLAGGQLPIPVAQSTVTSATTNNLASTVQFKDFGVGLSFTPTVIGKELINLEVNSQVSSIDSSIAILGIPGLKVRRAKTTIELKDGQSFSIAGLLQDDFQDGVSKFPFLGNIPILGALFRSTNYQQEQTELVVLITARLVDPGIARNLASPTESVILPSPFSLFGEGKLEGGTPPPAGPGTANPSGFV